MLVGSPRAIDSATTALDVAYWSDPPSRCGAGSWFIVVLLIHCGPPTTNALGIARLLMTFVVAAGTESLLANRIGSRLAAARPAIAAESGLAGLTTVTALNAGGSPSVTCCGRRRSRRLAMLAASSGAV